MRTITNRHFKHEQCDIASNHETNPISENHEAIIRSLVFEHGGVSSAVRRIVWQWPGRFSVVQIKIALAKRCPLLVPNRWQVEDCIEALERRRFIVCVVFRHSKIYQRRYFKR